MSGVFDLDDEGARALDLEAVSNPLDPSKLPPGMWEGTGQAFKGLLRPSAAAGRAISLIGGPIAQTVDAVSVAAAEVGDVVDEFRIPGYQAPRRKESTAAQDWYFRNVTDDLGSDAVDYWTPDPETMGSASKALNVGTNVVGSLPQILGLPTVFLGTSGADPALELTRQGVDTPTALGVGGVSLLANAIGMKLPASFGNTLTTRLATGAGANLAVGATSDAASGAVLGLGGYEQQAEGYNVADPYARGLDILLGAAFGARAQVEGATRVTPAQREAVLVAKNNDHLHRQTLPGDPINAAAARAHSNALTEAMAQVLRGEPVDIASMIRPEDYRLPAAAAATSSGFSTSNEAPTGYPAYRRALESGGRADARNPTSSAFGADQFTEATWLSTVNRAAPAWAEGLSREELLAARGDAAKSGEMAAALDESNAAALRAAGQPVDRHTLYATHHFGEGRGVDFARAAGDTPMTDILTTAQIKANAYLRGLTKDQAIANWDARARRAGVTPDGDLVDTNPAGQALRARLVEDPDQLMRDYAQLEDSQGGVVLNTDTARELSPEYLADRTRSADVHEAASDTVKLLYERKLAQPTPAGFEPAVLFTAGGTGAGKTTAIQAAGDALGKPEIVYDTNMKTLSSAVTKIDQALAAGREVRIAYVYRDPVEALTGGAIPRAQRQAAKFGTGRTVPIEEHARTHAGVRPVMEAVAARYADDPRVQLVAIDNSRGKGQTRVVELADLPRVEENQLRERLQDSLEEARSAGLAESLYQGFAAAGRKARPEVGAGDGGRPQSGGDRAEVSALETPLQAAKAAAAQSPDFQILDGFDADGQPRYRSMAEALAEIDAELQAAVNDAQAYPAAVNCALRRGF